MFILKAVLILILTFLSYCEADKALSYHILEELPPNTLIGNVPTDSQLGQLYQPSVFQQLRYNFLETTGFGKSLFSIEEETGIIKTTGALDRDILCPRQQTCKVNLDIVVKPAQYFRIIRVFVEIIDQNDNAPKFPQKIIAFSIPESRLPETSFVIPAASDPDGGRNSVQKHQLLNHKDMFRLRVSPGIDDIPEVRLVLKKQLDREKEPFYQVNIKASDGGIPPKSTIMTVNITVLDVNDNNPVFDNSSYELTISENFPVDATIVRVHASDPDSDRNGQIVYSFTENTMRHYGGLFGINPRSGDIFIKGEVDYEKRSVYNLGVMATDSGPDSQPARALVIVKVIDINDNAPKITVNILTEDGIASVSEKAEFGTFVAHASVVDRDTGKNKQFNCSLNSDAFKLQRLYQTTQYKIVVAGQLDYETHPKYKVNMTCQDEGTPPLLSQEIITVQLVDENDNPPIFTEKNYLAAVYENNRIGQFIIKVNATDSDSEKNGEVHYHIAEDPAKLFRINRKTGVVTADAKLDREKMDLVRFHVVAVDQGKPKLSATAVVSVDILDKNDVTPKFKQDSYAFGIFENQESEETEVGTVEAEDADTGDSGLISYSFDESKSSTEAFSIHPTSGKITTRVILDREQHPVYYLVVMAKDHGFPSLSSSVSVTVYVADKNDNAPVIRFPSPGNNTVFIAVDRSIGEVVSKIQAYDADVGNNEKLSYTIKSGNDKGVIKIYPSGDIVVNTELSPLEGKSFAMVVEVKDHGFPQLSAAAHLNIFINSTTGALVSESQTGQFLAGHNLTIVVSLASVSTVLAVILVVAIVTIQRQGRVKAKNAQRYNCRVEAEKMLYRTDSKNLSQTAPNQNDKAKKEVSFSVDMENTMNQTRQSWPSTIDHKTLENPRACSSLLNAPSPQYTPDLAFIHENPDGSRTLSVENLPPRRPGPVIFAPQTRNSQHINQRPLTERELEVHQLLTLLKREDEAESDGASSTDASNTDSGKGGSEEGELGHCRVTSDLDIPHTTGRKRKACHLHSCGGSNPINQSYSSPQPYSPANSSYHRNITSNSSITDNTQVSCASLEDNNASYNQGTLHRNRDCSDSPSIHKSGPKEISPKKNNHVHFMPAMNTEHVISCSESGDYSDMNEDTVDESNVIQYSCTDMDSHVGDSAHCSYNDTTDATSSTSGSYVVDPNELVKEIDELFFQDMMV